MSTKVMEIEGVGTLTQMYAQPPKKLTSLPQIVESMVLQGNGATYDITSLLPDGWKIEDLGFYGAWYEFRAVSLGNTASGLDHLMSSLHEIGHACDYISLKRQGVDAGEIAGKVRDVQSWINLRLDDVIDYLKLEYKAWEFALAFIRKLSVGEETLAHAYQIIMGYSQTNIEGMFTLWDLFAGRDSPSANVERNTGIPQEEQNRRILQQYKEFLERNLIK